MPDVSISPAWKKNPSIVKNVEFAGTIRTEISTVMSVMSVWIKELRENTNAVLTPGMMSAVFALKTPFQAARSYPARTRFMSHVGLP